MAASLTALCVGAFHVPQPFLAVLAAQLIGGLACGSGREFLNRLVAAWAGSLTGVFILVAAPDQPWISLPLFGLASGLGIVFAARRRGPAAAVLFAMGIGGMFSAGLVYPGAGLLAGMAHASSLSIAAIVSALAWSVCMGRTTPAPPGTESLNPAIIGLSAMASFILAALTVPAEAVVMTIATMTTILALQTSPGSHALGARGMGAAVGILVSVAFLVIVSGSGNNFAVFLAVMAAVMGGFEWLASSHPGKGALFRQAAAIFAVAATMLPRPDEFLFAAFDRMSAVVLGFGLAVAFHLIPTRLTSGTFPAHAG